MVLPLGNTTILDNSFALAYPYDARSSEHAVFQAAGDEVFGAAANKSMRVISSNYQSR